MKKVKFRALGFLFLLFAFLSIETVVAQEKPLTIGIFPRRDVTVTKKLFTPLAEYLAAQLGREVSLETRLDFTDFWKEVEAGAFDIIHYNQYHYIKAHKSYGHVAIARNEEMGSSLIGGAIFVRKDSGFKSVQDLKGKKIVFGGGKGAMQSYIIATHLLRQGGLGEGDYIEDFSRNPPNAIKSVFHKQVVAGGAGDVVIQLPIVATSINVDEMTMLTQSERYPHLPWAVKGDMAPALRDKIQSVLTSLEDTPEGKAVLKSAKLDGLVASTDSDFDPHRKIVKEVKGEEY